ncbi:MAG: type II secretion system protein [Nitrospirota bacterium]
MKRFFKQKGVSLIELLIAGFLLIIVSLFVSSIFMRSSINLVSSWDETVSLSTMQELVEEIKGAARDPRGPYSYIVMRGTTTSPTTHYHINIPTLVHSNTNVDFTVVAHTANNERNDEENGAGSKVQPMWELVEGSIGTPTLEPHGPDFVIFHKGIGNGTLQFPALATGTTRARGYLSIPNSPRRGIIVYPQAGERIEEGDIKGTRTASFELFNDPLDGLGTDTLPGDYMKGTITFSYQRKSQTGTGTKNMVTIIAPFPE